MMAVPADRLRLRFERFASAASRLLPFLLLLVVVFEWNGIPGQPRDSIAYFRAANAARDGSNIYEPLPPPGPHEFAGEWFYLYPPPLAALLSFLPAVDYRTFDRIWLVANVLAFVVLGLMLAKVARGSWTVRGGFAWSAALLFLPGAALAIHFGNLDVMILALFASAMAVPWLAGLTLGCAAAFKVAPVWSLAAVLLRRPRLTLPGLAAAVVLCVGACLIVFGLDGTVAYVIHWTRDIMPTVSQGQFWGESLEALKAGGLTPVHYFSNLSLSFLPVQIAVLAGWGHDGGALPAGVRAYLTLIAIGGPLVAAWLTRHRTVNVQASIIMAAALLCAPIVRPYVLAIALVVLAALREERRTRRTTTPVPDEPVGPVRLGV
jgi:hypothetical protein